MTAHHRLDNLDRYLGHSIVIFLSGNVASVFDVAPEVTLAGDYTLCHNEARRQSS